MKLSTHGRPRPHARDRGTLMHLNMRSSFRQHRRHIRNLNENTPLSPQRSRGTHTPRNSPPDHPASPRNDHTHSTASGTASHTAPVLRAFHIVTTQQQMASVRTPNHLDSQVDTADRTTSHGSVPTRVHMIPVRVQHAVWSCRLRRPSRDITETASRCVTFGDVRATTKHSRDETQLSH